VGADLTIEYADKYGKGPTFRPDSGKRKAHRNLLAKVQFTVLKIKVLTTREGIKENLPVRNDIENINSSLQSDRTSKTQDGAEGQTCTLRMRTTLVGDCKPSEAPGKGTRE